MSSSSTYKRIFQFEVEFVRDVLSQSSLSTNLDEFAQCQFYHFSSSKTVLANPDPNLTRRTLTPDLDLD